METQERTLVTALEEEIRRNEELLEAYRSIGAPGLFGATMIASSIKEARNALANDDAVECLRCLEKLRTNK